MQVECLISMEKLVGLKTKIKRQQLKSVFVELGMSATCDFQQCGILTSVDSDEPVQPPFKLIKSKLYSVSSLTLIEYLSDKQRL